MVENIMRAAGIRAIACANIGYSILDAIRDPAEFEALVIEMSSFQLHHTKHFEPLVSAVLNVADDHLDWHGTFEAYAEAKGKIYHNTKAACIYNAEDKVTYSLMQQSRNTGNAQAVGFTRFTPTPNEVGWVEDILVDRAFVDTVDFADELVTLGDLSKISVISPHLLANVAAAAAIARAAGVQPEEVRLGLSQFELDAHRIQLVLERDGIQWVDDSKATNPHAADAALSSFDSVIWVVGGLLKGVDISNLVAKHSKKLKLAIVIGKERGPVLEALSQNSPSTPIIEIESPEVMTAVVEAASKFAVSGDTVLLAPAAASMDQFIDYADRGKAFQQAVLKEHGNG
jgi:UDP-N-acetylmuramoylalanine--D-glutamate ligase